MSKTMPLPNFIIAGETKCGTTSMYNNLIQHSKVLPTLGNGDKTITDDGDKLSIKELRFFDRYYNRGWDWYKSCFPECPEGYITGEATPMYLYRTQAIRRIASVLKDCKIIVMLRDPTDRLISHYLHIYNLSKEWRERYPTLGDFWNSAHESDYYLIEKGIYWQTLVNLYKYHQISKTHIIISEELFCEPNKVWEETLAFLNLPVEPLAPKHSRKNNKRTSIDFGIYKDIKEFYSAHNTILKTLLQRDLPWHSH